MFCFVLIDSSNQLRVSTTSTLVDLQKLIKDFYSSSRISVLQAIFGNQERHEIPQMEEGISHRESEPPPSKAEPESAERTQCGESPVERNVNTSLLFQSMIFLDEALITRWIQIESSGLDSSESNPDSGTRLCIIRMALGENQGRI